MSIKTTRQLTRAAALERREQLLVELGGQPLTDKRLGDLLDILEEETCRRRDEPCFTNYLVTDQPEDR